MIRIPAGTWVRWCLLLSSCLGLPLLAAPPPEGKWQMVFHDEFDGASLDSSTWECRLGPRHWSEQRAANVTVNGGMLRIALRKEPAGGLDYTAGGVISRQACRYGYYEARVKMP